MEIYYNRNGSGKGPDDISTIGCLIVNGQSCLILEDDHDDVKEYGHTRIPAGRYEIKLRNWGGHHERYTDRFKAIHKGMLWLQDVPNYKDILIHCGQTPVDTKGCLLTGSYRDPNDKNRVLASGKAYEKIYPLIADPLEKGERVFINIID